MTKELVKMKNKIISLIQTWQECGLSGSMLEKYYLKFRLILVSQ